MASCGVPPSPGVAGSLSSDRMEAILRAQLRREAVAKLRALHERAPREELTPEIEQEIVEAVREVRAERRRRNAG
jgi:hypothetical protein